MRPSSLLLSLACALTAAAAEPAPQPSQPAFIVELGLGAYAAPAYAGSAQTTVLPVVTIEARYRDLIASTNLIDGLMVGASLGPDDDHRIVVGVTGLLGRDSDDDDRLAGQPDRNGTVAAALYGIWSLPPGLIAGRLKATSDMLDTGNGTRVTIDGLLRAPPLDHLYLQVGGGVRWSDRAHQRGWYGSAAGSSATPGAGYQPSSGVEDVHVLLEAVIPITGRWQGLVTAEWARLLGDAGRSPLTAQRDQFSILGVLIARL